jgi:hypothetical protein
MAKHARKVNAALRARQHQERGIPNSGFYNLGNGKRGYFVKPGSQNRKKGYGGGRDKR